MAMLTTWYLSKMLAYGVSSGKKQTLKSLFLLFPCINPTCRRSSLLESMSQSALPLYRQSMSMNVSFSSPMQPCQMISHEDQDQCQETWKQWEKILMSSSLKLSRLDGHSFLHLICAPGKYVIFITCRQSSLWLIMCCSLYCYFILNL